MDIFILQKVLSTWSWWNLKSRSYAPDRIISIDLGQGLELLPGIDLKTQALREIGTAHQFTVLQDDDFNPDTADEGVEGDDGLDEFDDL